MKISRETTEMEKVLWTLVGIGIAILLIMIGYRLIGIGIEQHKLNKPLREIEIFDKGKVEIDCDYVLNGVKVVGKKEINYKLEDDSWHYEEGENSVDYLNEAIEINGNSYKSLDSLLEEIAESDIEEEGENEYEIEAVKKDEEIYKRAEKFIKVMRKANFNMGASLNKEKSYIKMNGETKLSLEVNNNNLVNLLSISDIYLGDNDKDLKIYIDCYYSKDKLERIEISFEDFLNSMIAYSQAKGIMEGSYNIMTGNVNKLVFTISN